MSKMMSKLSMKWKVTLIAIAIFLPAMALGTFYFFYQAYGLEVKTSLGGLMNFVDAKQQGVIRFLGQNQKFARQLAAMADRVSPEDVRAHFQTVVATDTFKPEDHPFRTEIDAGKRRIATWKVYHAIDFVRDGVIAVSSDPAREGKRASEKVAPKAAYSDVYMDGETPVITFAASSPSGVVHVHADARMLTLIVNGEVGNLEGTMGAYYLAGVGDSFDYYIVNRDNLMITESRVRPAALLKLRGSEHPWRVTQQDRSLNILCGKNGTYLTNAGCTTGCREAMGFYDGPQGKRMLGASMPFYDTGWTIVVEQEADELLSPLYRQLFILALIGVVLAVLATVTFVVAITRMVFRPLKTLASKPK